MTPQLDWYTGRPIVGIGTEKPSYIEFEGGVKLYTDVEAFEGREDLSNFILVQVVKTDNIVTFTFNEMSGDDVINTVSISAVAYELDVTDPDFMGGESFNPFFPDEDEDEPAVVADESQTADRPEAGFEDPHNEAVETELVDSPETADEVAEELEDDGA